jgi:hypothetical protein
MSRIALVFLAGLVLPGLAWADKKPKASASVAAGAFTVSGPHRHANLSVFLIHGENKLKDRTILTLDQALEQKKIVVYETQTVNWLDVENVSASAEVFIAAGDIVKGGHQDRVLSVDLLVPAMSGRLSIRCFCVEKERWRQRGTEAAEHFSSSKFQLSTRELKLANRLQLNQEIVWQRVANVQVQISANLGVKVNDQRSNTSLQLSLENKTLQDTIDGYIKDLSGCVGDHNDVIGFAFAINGHINSADIYPSSELFHKLWPKLLKASAIEAVAELHRVEPPKLKLGEVLPKANNPGQAAQAIMRRLNRQNPFHHVTTEKVAAFLTDAAKGTKTERRLSPRLVQVQLETDKSVQFETRDRELPDGFLRLNILAK